MVTRSRDNKFFLSALLYNNLCCNIASARIYDDITFSLWLLYMLAKSVRKKQGESEKQSFLRLLLLSLLCQHYRPWLWKTLVSLRELKGLSMGTFCPKLHRPSPLPICCLSFRPSPTYPYSSCPLALKDKVAHKSYFPSAPLCTFMGVEAVLASCSPTTGCCVYFPLPSYRCSATHASLLLWSFDRSKIEWREVKRFT